MAATVYRFRGGLALQGPVIDDAAREFRTHIQTTFRDTSTPYHITLLTKEEYHSRILLPGTAFDYPIPTISVDHLYFLGLGGAQDRTCNSTAVFWVVCTWAAGAAWRMALGLPPKNFHITLTANDVHSAAKDASSLLNPEGLTAAFHTFSPAKQDHVLHHLNSIRSGLTLPLTISRALANSGSAKDFLRLGDASANGNPKLAMLAYARALTLDPSSSSPLLYITRRLHRLASRTHYGPLMTVMERESIPESLRAILLRDSWCAAARHLGHDLIPLESHPTTPVVESRDRLWYKSHELPRFFSWIVPYFLAGMSTPRNEQDVDILADLGITRVVTLTKEEPLPASWFAYKSIQNVFIPVENFKAPTFKAVDYFLDAVTEYHDDAVWLVHCGGGKGRAGTMLACYIAMYGFRKPGPDQSCPQQPVYDAGTVIRWLRTIRPGSIETAEQEKFIASWISYRWKLKVGEEDVPEPFGLMSIEGRIPPHPELLILVGLPGSGKSWFSSAIQKRAVQGMVDVVSQDEIGSRAACESAVSRRCPGSILILDRCNPARDERKLWLALADAGENAVAVYFDIDSTVCTQRIDRRIHHPTLRAGRSDNAMKQMKRQLSKPTLDEGFSAILTVPSMDAARQAVKTLTEPPPLVKFPRTEHLINLGAACADDLIAGSFPRSTSSVVVEEKVDGANMGISLDWNGSLVVQNRSHTVTSRSHAQFRKLETWLQSHAPSLHAVLHRDAQFPERFILYGEWMAATHSIAYSRLPDLFLAFDFYDRVTKSFASREALSRLLHNTGIHQVPVLSSHLDGAITPHDLISLVSRPSAFYDGPVEGVYVRFEDPDRLLTVGRGKVVRADFISGNEHWSKGIIHLNTITSHSSTS